MARAGAAVAGYALIELALGLFWDRVPQISLLLAMVTWAACWFGVVDRAKSRMNLRVMSDILRSVPFWWSALWALSMLALIVTFAVVAGRIGPPGDARVVHFAISLLAFFFSLSSSLVA